MGPAGGFLRKCVVVFVFFFLGGAKRFVPAPGGVCPRDACLILFLGAGGLSPRISLYSFFGDLWYSFFGIMVGLLEDVVVFFCFGSRRLIVLLGC